MTETALGMIRIVLVEPAGALNVGSVARVMKNMGLSHLVLVQPHCDWLGGEARQMAVHAGEVLAGAQVVQSLPEALVGCQRAIATTGQPRTDTPLEHPRTTLPWLLEGSEPAASALIFGPEDRGLNNTELNYAHRFVYIPTNPDYTSLNLAQAVAICSYELYQWDNNLPTNSHQPILGSPAFSISPLPPSLPPPLPHPPAPLDQLEAYYQHLEAVLLQIGYLYPHTADSRMKKFRRLFHRAMPSSEEVTMLRGVLSQVEWAVQKARTIDPAKHTDP